MNAKVTTYWMFGKKIEQAMPETQVEKYLTNCRGTGTLKGYVVDAVPEGVEPPVQTFQNGDKVYVAGAVAYAVGPNPAVPGQYVIQNSKNLMLRSVPVEQMLKL